MDVSGKRFFRNHWSDCAWATSELIDELMPKKKLKEFLYRGKWLIIKKKTVKITRADESRFNLI